MKILLIGEYGGFYNALAAGLERLGHNVFLANTGDGARGLYSNYNWIKYKGLAGKVYSVIDLMLNQKLFVGYDVVQLIMPKLNSFLWLNKQYVVFLKRNNGAVFWTPSGASDVITKYWVENQTLRCPVYDFHAEEACKNGKILSYRRKGFLDYENWFCNYIDGIIPIMFEYSQPFIKHKKFIATIPLPINTDIIKYKENFVNNKIVFFHGITRPVKGSKFICEAFSIMQKRFHKDADFFCNTAIPYHKYLEVIQSTNVIADQTNSFSSGLNGLIGLAKGKVVLGGSDPISFAELGYTASPIINIVSNVEQICSQIEVLIKRKYEFPELGRSGREFIESHHHYINIAMKYLAAWSKSNCITLK